jgi:CheY-like chemotaxis protein
MDQNRKTVLLVDDDVDIIEQYKQAVEKEYNVLTAHSGEETLEKLSQIKPDCIVLDVMMSHLSDGLDLSKKIKEDSATKDIPIIMLTGVNQSYDYSTQIDKSYFPYDKWLDKPIKPKKLVQEIKSILK